MRGKLIMLALAVAVVLVLRVRTFDVTDEREPSQAETEALRTASSDQAPRARSEFTRADERSAAQPLSQQRLVAADQSRVLREDSVRVRAETAPNESAEPEARTQTEVVAPDTASEAFSIDYSFVSQPFPVSESILAACGKSRPQRACELNKLLLAEFTGEPREEPWASSVERAIRALVELEPGTERPRAMTHTIRALECRRTICFVETASIMEAFHTQFFYFERHNRLHAGYSMSASEIKQDGNKVYVTLLPVVRTSRSTSEGR